MSFIFFGYKEDYFSCLHNERKLKPGDISSFASKCTFKQMLTRLLGL